MKINPDILSPQARNVCERIAGNLSRRGFPDCTFYDVMTTWAEGTHENAALASAILQELEEYGFA